MDRVPGLALTGCSVVRSESESVGRVLYTITVVSEWMAQPARFLIDGDPYKPPTLGVTCAIYSESSWYSRIKKRGPSSRVRTGAPGAS